MVKNSPIGTLIVLYFTLIFLVSTAAPSVARTLKSYSKIFVVTQTEDTTSEFHEVLFYNSKNELVRVIDMWNGGHVGPTFAHEYVVNGRRLKYVRTIDPIWQSKTMVKDVLCKKLKTYKVKDPPKLKYDDLLVHGEDREPFTGCK